MEKFSELPREERDRRYLARLESIARVRIRLPPERARAWARKQFRARFGHEPTAGVA
jgi:hypothetical protein